MPLDVEKLKGISRAKLARIATEVNRRIAGPMMVKFVRQNFLAGGRPTFASNSPLTLWLKKLKGFGRNPLVETGTLFSKAIDNPVVRATPKSVILRPRSITGTLRKSINILHFGGTVTTPRTDKMRKFFWAMHFTAEESGNSTIADAFKAMALSPKAEITRTIPARPWTKLTNSQIARIKQAVSVEWARIMSRFAATGVLKFRS